VVEGGTKDFVFKKMIKAILEEVLKEIGTKC